MVTRGFSLGQCWPAKFLSLAMALVLILSALPIPVGASYQVRISEGEKLPEIVLYDSSGQPVKLEPAPGRHLFFWSFPHGSLNMLNTGRTALPGLSAVAEEFRGKGLDIVVVTPDRGLGPWFELMEFDFTVLWDDDEVLANITGYGFNTVSVGVGSDGMVRSVKTTGPYVAHHSQRWARVALSEVVNWPQAADAYIPEGIAVGSQFPDFGLRQLDGGVFFSKELAGTPACYVFWHPQCSFSVSTVVRLRELFPEFNARGVEFVAVTGDVRDVYDWLGSNAMPFIHLRDDFDDVASSLGFYAVPGMVVVNEEGIVTFAGLGNDIHDADLRSLLEEVAGPPIAGQPDSDRDLEPLVAATGDFFGMDVFFDPLFSEDMQQQLATGLRAGIEEVAGQLGLAPEVLRDVDAHVTFYADAVRYFNDSFAPCYSLGYCTFNTADSSIGIYVQWVTSLEGTLTIARHELVHALLKLRIGQIPPMWFDEGCADVFTRATSVDYWGVYNISYVAPSAATVEAWWTGGEENQIRLMEAREVSHGVVDYMFRQYGEEGFAELLDNMAAGQDLEAAISTTWGISFSRFWDDFWKQTYATYQRAADDYQYVSYFDDVEISLQFSYLVDKLPPLGLYPAGGHFRPTESMTRGEFADLLLLALNQPPELANDLYAPNDAITRYQAAAMTVHALGLPLVEQPGEWGLFVDMEDTPEWAGQHLWTAIVFMLVDEYLVTEYEAEVPLPSVFKELSRAEAAVWVLRAHYLRMSLAEKAVVESLNLSGQPQQETSLPREGSGAPDEPSGTISWMLWVAGAALLLAAAAGLLRIFRLRATSN